MDITVTDDGIYVSALVRFKFSWNKDKSLSVKQTKGGMDFVLVNSQRGVFVDALDSSGNVIASGGDGVLLSVSIGARKITIRRKVLPDPKLSKPDLDKQRTTVTRTLVCDAPYSLNIPDTLHGVIEWITERELEIPKACRDSASFSFDTTVEYGETYPRIRITYEQAETDAEVIHRVKVERERARIRDLAERAELRRLKDKLETAKPTTKRAKVGTTLNTSKSTC